MHACGNVKPPHKTTCSFEDGMLFITGSASARFMPQRLFGSCVHAPVSYVLPRHVAYHASSTCCNMLLAVLPVVLPAASCLSDGRRHLCRASQVDLEAQTRQVAEREAAAAEQAATLRQRAAEVTQAERDAAAGREALEMGAAARVSSLVSKQTNEQLRSERHSRGLCACKERRRGSSLCSAHAEEAAECMRDLSCHIRHPDATLILARQQPLQHDANVYRPERMYMSSSTHVSIIPHMSRMQTAEEARLSEDRAALADREARAAAREAAAAEAAAAVDRRAEAAEAAARTVAEREAELRRLQGEVWTKVRACDEMIWFDASAIGIEPIKIITL